MIRIRNGRLTATAAKQLEDYQQDVDDHPDYAMRVARAKSQFSARNKNTNGTFVVVREKLTNMCNGSRRCMYCEDSVADEVEHFQPKDLYPEVVFAWRNYLYACGPCNGPKNNKFSVVDAGTETLVDVTRPRRALVIPPQDGQVALISPRHEDPLEYMMLDIRDTFEFTPLANAGTLAFLRADYTIRILDLNGRDYLVSARRNSFGAYRARLREYIQQRDAGASPHNLTRLRSEMQQSPHPTVWAEMKRQHQHHPSLAALFRSAPEALNF